MKVEVEIKNEILEAARAVNELYNHPEGIVGGYGHIVFDDENLDMVDICLYSCTNKEYAEHYSEELRLLSEKALLAFKQLDEDEMMIALLIHRGKLVVIGTGI